MKILAIDYGTARFGVAGSDGDLAEAIGTYTVTTNLDKVDLIRKLLREYNPTMLIIGKTGGVIDKKVDSFLQLIKPFYTGQIVIVDETMTTRMAQSVLRANAAKREKSQKQIDQFAAAVMLQGYLDDQNGNNQ